MRAKQLAAILTAAMVPSAWADRTVVFFNGGLNKTEGPGEIAFATDAAEAEASFEDNVAYGGGVMFHTAAFGDQGVNGLFFDTGSPPNGGGDYINDYTVIYDIRLPQDYNWNSFIQTNDSNSNDGDLFARPEASGDGIGISGVYDGDVIPETWQRFAFTFDSSVPGVELKKYIDGALVGTQNLGSGVDGRWSLYSTDDAFFNGLYLLADNDGDVAAGHIGGFLFDDRTYSESEIEAFDGASFGTLPEPGALMLLAIGGLLGLRRRA
jgi:hypothetical protein